MITRSSIAFEDFLGSSIVPQVMPPWFGGEKKWCLEEKKIMLGVLNVKPLVDLATDVAKDCSQAYILPC